MDTSAVFVWRVYKVPIVLGAVSLLCIALSIILFIKSYQSSTPITFSSDTPTEATVAGSFAQNTLMIDIEGAVEKPGVYQLPMGSRVEDAIAQAGGFSSDADMDMIAKVLNRAAKLSDGAKLFIPVFSQNSPQSLSAPSSHSSLININSSSQSDLEALTGIGPATAKKIIAGRPYQTLEELVSKKAMSQSLMTKLKDQLTL